MYLVMDRDLMLYAHIINNCYYCCSICIIYFFKINVFFFYSVCVSGN